MKVLFPIAGLHPESGGPSHSVPALCQALSREGVEVEIVSLHYGDTFDKPLNPASSTDILSVKVGQASSLSSAAASSHPSPPQSGRGLGEVSSLPSSIFDLRTTFVDCSSAFARRTQWTPKFKSLLRERCRATGAQIIHDTGLWLLTNHAAASVSAELNLPRIVSPRGMLTSWALRHKGWKKRMAWSLYQRQDLLSAQVLHATSPAELQDFRAAGLKQPIAMIPNGVELPALEDRSWKMEDREGFPTSNSNLPSPSEGPISHLLTPRKAPPHPSPISYLPSPREALPSRPARIALFLGRIHPIKGLLDLVKAWALVRPPGWRMIIAGSDEMGHTVELKAEIRKQKLERDFEFVGPVQGDAKWNLYREADLFVLPSHSENFGIVVAEALASGVPVITTRGTPWEDLVAHRCGWWTENGSDPIAAALREAVSRTDEDRREMGRRGRQLVAQKYAWPAIAAQMHAVYRWMLGQGAKPACLIEG